METVFDETNLKERANDNQKDSSVNRSSLSNNLGIMQFVSAKSWSAGQRVGTGNNRTGWDSGRSRSAGESGDQTHGVRNTGSVESSYRSTDVGQQAYDCTSVRHNRQGDWGNEFGHRRYGDVLLQPDIRRPEPEVQPTSSGNAASAATSGQAASSSGQHEPDNGRREDSHGSNASAVNDAVKWLDKIIRPHIEQELLRIKAREAAAKLPPPAPMVQGPNVLAQPKIQISQWKVEPQKIQKETENKMPLVVMILGVVGQLVDGLISNGMKANWPKDLIDAIVAASSAIGAAHSLAVTKAGLEANRQVPSTPTA